MKNAEGMNYNVVPAISALIIRIEENAEGMK
jgi:hypothetical protein